MNIGVIFGGKSVEHDISIITGLQVIKNLDPIKYNIYPIYLTKNNYIICSKKLNSLENVKKIGSKKGPKKKSKIIRGTASLFQLEKLHKRKKIDLIFNCTHGFGAEDGVVSGILDFYAIPNTSSNILSSSIAQDKDMTKRILNTINVPMLDYLVIKKEDKNNLFYLTKDIKYPVIIKPAHLGSSIGIFTAKNQVELVENIKHAFVYDDKIIIEELLNNFKEYSVSIYKRKNEFQLSKIEELDINSEIFTFDEKYINHHKEVTHYFLKDKDFINQIYKMTIDSYNLLEMNGIVRFDYLYSDGNIYLNEINTIPGGLSNYLYKDKISFKLLLDEQVRETLYKFKKKNELLTTFNSNVLSNNNISFKK